MGRIVASDLYPAIRRFLEENECARTLKAFGKETADEEGGGGKPKKARILKGLELVEACQLWYNERAKSTVSAANLYPAFRRFFSETGLERTLKALNKEVEEGENGGAKPKKAAILEELELTEAVQVWYAGKLSEASAAADDGAAAKPAAAAEGGKKRKRAQAEEEEEAEAAAEEAPAKEEAEDQENKPPEEEVAETPKKKKQKKDKEERKPGVPFKRIDETKWTRSISDERLKDNTHEAKMKYGGSAGDAWGNKAAEDLLKVKGKGFRKEMAKKKRASWRGGGEIDQGVNSIKFEDSDDE